MRDAEEKLAALLKERTLFDKAAKEMAEVLEFIARSLLQKDVYAAELRVKDERIA